MSGLLDSGAEVHALTHNPDSAGLPEGVESSGPWMRKGRTAGSVMGVSGWVMAMVVSYSVDRTSLGQRSQPSNYITAQLPKAATTHASTKRADTAIMSTVRFTIHLLSLSTKTMTTRYKAVKTTGV